MRLIAEELSEVEFITEELVEGSGNKSYKIRGVFMQSDVKNRNGRVYPQPILAKEVAKYNKNFIQEKRAFGELGHPDGPTVNLERVSHMITDLYPDGKNFIGEAKIMSTPMGEIVKGLLDGEVRLGVSTRGMGSLEKKGDTMVVKDDYILNTVDIVQDPSAPNAFVNGVMEGVEWVWNNGIIEQRAIEKMETEIKKAPRADLYETQVREFKNFLSLLKTKL